MSNRNRDAGHNYERQVLNKLQMLYTEKLVTARAESRNADAFGIDILGTGPIQVQCKLQKTLPDLTIFNKMKEYCQEAINVIVWGRTKRAEKNMIKNGDYVIMKLNDFVDLIDRCREGEV